MQGLPCCSFRARCLRRRKSRSIESGNLSPRAGKEAADDAFLRGMEERGYTVGRNLVVEYRWAGNDLARLQPLAEDLVRLPIDVIVTATSAGTRAAMAATRTIPIVMAASADPVAAGLVATLGRPGGNVTGISLQTTDLARKREQLLREVVRSSCRPARSRSSTGLRSRNGRRGSSARHA